MNTTAAATQAHVTVATIRTWCRKGVITATKTAGRWIIDTASLAARITIGQLKARKERPVIDLTATYTTHDLRTGALVTITPTVKTRTRGGATITTIRGLAPLLADKIDAITDEAQRLHTVQALHTASITISDHADETSAEGTDGITAWRDHGRLLTGYQGTSSLPIEAVLDLAENLRTHLAK